MSAPSADSSRCAEAARCAPQRGAAVITALLTVALVAGIASAMVGSYGVSLESLAGRHDQAQARWLARAAVDWGRNVLADDFSSNTVDHLGETWAVKVPPTPVEEGEVSGELRDVSGRFNLNNLVVGEDADEDAAAAFVRLLESVGVSTSEATAATLNLLDWMDTDSVSRLTRGDERSATGAAGARAIPPNGQLAHEDELVQVPGFDAQLVARLKPFVAALPGPSKLNVNTASAEVLHAMLPDLPLDAARILVAERERAWFKDVADFNARLPEGVQGFDPAVADVRSRHIIATGRARFGLAVARMEVLLDRQQRWPTIVWQRIL